MEDETVPWRPLSRRSDTTYDVLVDYVPAWLRPSLWTWVEPQLRARTGMVATTLKPPVTYNRGQLHEVERRLRVGFNWEAGASSAIKDLKKYMDYSKTNGALDVVDLLLSKLPAESPKIPELERYLKDAGSGWTPTLRGGICRLERRVNAATATAAQKTIDESGRAGELLGKAWRAVYGREPDASSGYRDAVRAVEAAAKPVISPDNAITTLGTVIRDMEAAPQKWMLRLSPAGGVNSVATLVNMIKLLWKAQFDRHGTPDENVPLNVSSEEAETALHLATTLVQWFASGAVAPRMNVQ